MEIESKRSRRVGGLVAAALAGASITLAMVSPWQAGAAPGDDDATFVPITACRLADTRPAANRVGNDERFGPAETKTFTGTGSNGQCSGIPAAAIGLSMNVTALGASEQSFLTFWGDGPLPLAASLNPSPSQPPLPNAVTTDLSPSGTFKVYNDRGTVDVVIDVNGYYTAASLTGLQGQVDSLAADLARLQSTLDGTNASVAALDADVASTKATVTALDAGLTSTNASVAALDDREPFAATVASSGALLNGSGTVVVLALPLTAPAAGSFTVNSTASIADALANVIHSCSITTGTSLNTVYEQRRSNSPAGAAAQIAGSRVIPVTSGQSITVRLVCKRNSISSFANVVDPVLTAIFTPTP